MFTREVDPSRRAARHVASRCLLLGGLLALSSLVVTRSASASPVDEKRREAERIANQIESLTDQSFDLGEEYDRVATELAQVDIEVAAAQKRVTELEAQVGSMRTAMQGVAVQSYIYGVQGEGVAAILGGAGGPAIAAQREQYTELVLGSSVSEIDELETVSQDATRERQNLEEKQAKKRTLQEALAAKQAEVDASIQKARALESTVKGQLATLVAQEQARRAQQAAARARQASPSQPASGNRTLTARSNSKASVPSGPRAGANVPAPSPGAAGAVAAALSQLGVGYRYASSSPGEAFDCSGLTAWAWEQAGRSLPHQSRSQYAATARVPENEVQPGDLVFYYNPIGHVGMYIGNGQMVHATNPGDVVKVAAVNWGKVVGIGRP
ncbi:MAG TPA: NlpC/P60 family protein [Acidimicrobiales bacterium]|nr:NlpC/P60 family protein [Acidimicrobiales bacterium]